MKGLGEMLVGIGSVMVMATLAILIVDLVTVTKPDADNYYINKAKQQIMIDEAKEKLKKEGWRP